MSLPRLAARVRTMVSRGKVVSAALNAKRTLLQLTGLDGETRTDIELLLPYGMSALPLAGGDLILLQSNGSRSHLIALDADDPELRIADLQQGEYGFRDARGQQVVFRQDRLEVTTPLKIVINVTGNAEVTVGGDINVDVTGSANVSVSGDVNLDVVGKVVASAAEFDLTGDLKVDGDISATGDVTDHTRAMQGDRDIYNVHRHGGVSSGGTTSNATDSPE